MNLILNDVWFLGGIILLGEYFIVGYRDWGF